MGSSFAEGLNTYTSSHQQLVASHKELSLATAADRDANERRWKKFEIGLHAVECDIENFMSGLKLTLEEMNDSLAGLWRKIDNNDVVTREIKTRLIALWKQLGETETEGFVKEVINEVHNMHKKHEGNLETGHQCLDTQETLTSHHLNMNECIDERSGFIDEQINQLQTQAKDLRGDLVVAITKEREIHSVNMSRHSTEISKFAKEWQTLENRFVLQAPMGSPQTPFAQVLDHLDHLARNKSHESQ